MKKNSMRLLWFLMAVVMVASLLTVGIFAEDTGNPVAKIGETGYVSFEDALGAAAAGDTITLLKDIANLDVTISKAITLDLGGKTVTDAYIQVAANVTIQNGSIKNTTESYPLVINGGTLTVENVAIEASKSDRAIWLKNSGTTLSFNSGSILATKGENNTSSKIYGVWVCEGATANINGGTITVDAGANATAVAIFGNYDNTVNVTGGRISTSGSNYSYAIWVDGDVTVTGGEIVTNEKCYGYSSGVTYGKNYAINSKGDVEISGGKITTNGPSGYLVNAGGSNQEITISGVEFTNVMSEADTTAGGHKAPNLIYGSSVTATITGGSFKGVSATLIKDTGSTLEVSGGSFDVDVSEYLAEGSKIVEKEDGTFEAYVLPKGNDFTGYTGGDAIWGEAWGNAKESFVIKVLDANGNVMGTTSLNNIGGIIDGDVNVTWSLKLDAASNTDGYWTMEWTTAPSAKVQPAKVELWVDGVKVSGGDVVLNGPDDLNKIYAAVTNKDGKILGYYTSVSAAISAVGSEQKVCVLQNVTISGDLVIPEGVTLDTNGKNVDVSGKVTNMGTIVINGGELKAAVVSNMAHMVVPEKVPPQFAEGATEREVSVSFVPEGATESRYSYTFTLAAGASVLDVPVDVLPDGKYNCTIVDFIDGQTHVILGTTTIVNGAIKINGGALTVSQTLANNYGTLAITGESELNLTGAEFNGNLLIPNANLTINGGTITNDDKSVSGIEINAGELILNNVTVKSARHALRIDGDVTVVINGGYYQSAVGTGTGTYHALHTSNGAIVTIVNGTFVGPKGNPNTTADSGSAVNVGSGCTVTIEGGNFYGGKAKTLQSAGTLTVEGGIFDQDPSAYVTDYKKAVKKDGDVYTIVPAVASIGNKGYASLIEALLAATQIESNETIVIQLMTDVREQMPTDVGLRIKSNVKLVSATGKPVDAKFYNAGTSYDFIINSADGFNGLTFTIGENVTFQLEDRIIWSGYYGNNVTVVVDGILAGSQYWNGANTIVNSTGILKSTGEALVMRRGATITVNGGKVQANYFNILSGNIIAENATIESGAFWIANTDGYANEGNVKISLKYSVLTSTGNLKSYTSHADGVSIELVNSTVEFNDFDGYGACILDAKTTLTVNGGTLKAASLTNNGAIEVEGESTLKITALTGKEVSFLDGSVIKDSTIGGGVVVASGNITFKGYNKIGNFNAGYNKPTITIGEGATLEMTSSARMVIGHGATFNIIGTITDAKTANVADLTPSLIAAGASFTGAGVNFNVKDAYIKFTAYCSSKNSSANGTFNINVENSIWEQTGSLVFTEPTEGKDPTFNFIVKDSVLNSTSHLVFGVTKGEIVFDNSNVNVGAHRQFENRSKLTIKNGSVVYAAHATSSNAKNPGTTIVDNATYVCTGEFSGSDVGVGTLIVNKGANVTMGKITKANIVVDATDMVAGDVVGLIANLSGLSGTIKLENNVENLIAEINDGKIVLVQGVASINGVLYKTLQAAIDACVAGNNTIKILKDLSEDVTIKQVEGVNVVIDGNDKTYSGTITIHGNARHTGAETLTIQNVNFVTDKAGHYFIDSNSTGSAERYAHNVTVENCTFTATPGTAAVNSAAAIRIRQGFNIVVKGSTANGMHSLFQAYGVSGLTITGNKVDGKNGISAGTSTDVVIEGNTIKATGYGIRADGDGAYGMTVKNNTVEAELPVVIRKATGAYVANVAEGNTLTATNDNGYTIVVTTGDDDETFVAPSDVELLVNAGANEKVFGMAAKIGNTYYGTFAQAYDAALEGETIDMLADVEATEVILIDKSLTINGNGHKVTSSATRVFRVTTSNVEVTLNDVNMVSSAKVVYPNDVRGISIDPGLSNIKLTLNNCSVDFTDASAIDWTYAVNVSGNGTGHTITINGGTYEGANVINVHGANNTIVVKNATLTSLYPNNDVYYGGCIWVLENQGSSVEATGNTFNGANAIAFNLGTGTTLTESGNTDNTTICVARIDNTYYTSLADAMNACKAGETVLLLHDVDLAGTEWEPVSFKGAFNGQGHTISNLTINKPGVSNVGFITSLNSTFENVTFTNPTVTGGECTGVIAGRAGGSAALAKNIKVNGTIKVETTHSGYARVAVIVGGWAYGNYENITVDGGNKNVSYVKHTGGGDGRYVAGIVGHADDVQSYVNCTVKDITISGGWLCGAIAGPGPSDGLASGCVVDNVNMNADYSGGMFGWYFGSGTIQNSSIKDVTFTDGSTNNGAIGGYSANTNAKVENVTFENVKNADGKPLLEHVASIGNQHFLSLAEALAAAQNGDTITLIWKNGAAPIAMNGSVFGKTVTITGTATVDWSKGFLFIGRGGVGNGTVIFDNANLTSASNSSSYGIHVSGREKNTNNKYDGTLVIKNSTIELDYLINRGAIEVDNSSFTVKNGFGIAGRPASETESSEAATATITIKNGSYVKVLNHNGMGIGRASTVKEGYGILNLIDSTFECANFNIDAALGDFNVYGESVLKIETLTGKEIDLHHNAIIKNSTVGGEVMLYGKVTFRGDNTFAMLYDYGNAYSTEYAEWIVEKGASLTLTEKARYGLGYGDKVVIYGDLTDALNARATLTDDDIVLFVHGLVAMSNWNVDNSFEVNNAYVVVGSNNSFGNSPKDAHTGNYTFTFKNSVLDASRITFYSANSKTNLTFNKSDVKVGQFMNRDTDSVFYLIGSKVLSTSTLNGNDEGNYLAGMLVLTNSSLTYSAPLVMENGTLTLDAKSSLTAPSITGNGTIVIDATGMNAGEYANITADASGFTGTIEVINNNKLYAVIENGKIVLVQYAAMIGNQGYKTLDAAFAAAKNDDEVKIMVAGTYALSTSGKNITITGAVDGVVFDNIGAKGMNGANVTFNNVTFDYYPNVNYTGLQHSGNLVYNDCTFNGQVFLYGQSETFNKCIFNQNSADAYNVWTYGAKEVTFNKCTFNSAGKSVLIYSDQKGQTNDVSFTKCTLNASSAVDGKAAIEMDSSIQGYINLTIDAATTATGFGKGNVSGNSLWNNKKGNNTDANNDITVKVGDETVLAPLTGTIGHGLQAVVNSTGRESVTFTLDKVFAMNELRVELWSNGQQISSTIYNNGACTSSRITVNIVIKGVSSSWTTVWLVDPSVDYIPDEIRVYADGLLVDTMKNDNGVFLSNGNHLDKFQALSGVYKVATITDAEGKILRHFTKLSDAIASVKNGEIIVLMADCNENVTVVQTPGVAFTIDGNDKTYTFTGTITVNGKSEAYETAGLTIKNVKFDATNISKDACINLGGNNSIRYTSNVTIDGCTFVGDLANEKAAIKNYTGGCKNLTVKNSSATGMHSMIQVKGVHVLTVENVTIEGCKNGIAVGPSTNVSITNAKITATGYGIRADGSVSATLTISGSTIKANLPVVVRKTSTAYIVDAAGNTFESNSGYAVVFTTGDDGTFVTPVGLETKAIVGENDNVFGMAAKIGNTFYGTFAQAYAAAKAGNGNTITLLTPVVITENTVLDLTGLIIESAEDAFIVRNDAILTLNGDGKVKAGTSGVGSWCAVWADGGHAIINGGTYSVGGDSNTTGTHQNDVIYTKNGGTVEINGGLFLNNGTVWTLNQNDTNGGKITVNGGIFQNWNPQNNVSEGVNTNFLTTKYAVTFANGYYTVVDSVAHIDGFGYATVADAIKGAKKGDTIVLRTSIVVTKDESYDFTGLTVDGNGVYPAFRVQNGATLTVNGGNIKNSDYIFVLGASDGTSIGNVVINGGSFYGETTVASVTKGTLTINGGEFRVDAYENGQNFNYMLNCVDANYNKTASIVVKGGTFYNFNPADNAAEGVHTNFVADGYHSVSNGNGSFTVGKHNVKTYTQGATCTSNGLTYSFCTECGKMIKAPELTPMVPHDYQLVPGDHDNGYEVYKCTTCDDKYTGDKLIADVIVTVDGIGYTDWAKAMVDMADGAQMIVLYSNVNNDLVTAIRGISKKAVVLDLNGYTLEIKELTLKSGNTMYIVDSSAKKTGSVIVSRILLEAGNDLRLADTVYYNGAVQMNNTKTYPSTFYVGDTRLVGTDGIFTIDQADTGYLQLILKDSIMDLTLGVGHLTMINDLSLLPQQKLTINVYGHLTIAEHVVLTLDADTTLSVLENNHGKGQIDGKGTIVVNTLDQFLTVLDTDIENIVLGTAMTISEDLTLDISGKTITATGDAFIVTAGTLTINGNGVVKAGTSGVGSWCAVWANGGNVVINGGTYSVGGDKESADKTHQNDVIYTKDKGTVVINGGLFLNDGTVWTLNENDANRGTITVNGGSFENWNPANNVSEGAGTNFLADGLCTAENNGIYEVMKHSYNAVVTAPTCTDKGYTTYTCSACGDTYVADETAALGHKYDKVVTAPTCTTEGYTTYTCSVCGYTYVADKVAAKGHTVAIDDAVAPTCTATGLTVGVHCSVCKEVLVKQETVAAKGHTWTPATYEASKTCSVCGATEGEALHAVAQIGAIKYETLAEAIAAAQNGDTITLLTNSTGSGVVIDKSITIDFAGYTYSFNEGVGSTGTQSNGFQILKGNTVTLKNGTLNVDASAAAKFYILVQNYADLTVTDMILDGTNLDKWSLTDGDSYTLSNNSGKVVVNGNTTIIANNDGTLAFAFDACDKSAWGYELPTVTVADTVVINGNVEAAAVVNGTYYATFADAYAAAKDTNGVIVLLETVVIDSATILENVTIVAEGINPAIRIVNNAFVAVNNVTFDTENYAFILGASDGSSAGNLHIYSGRFHSGTSVVSVTKGELVIRDGEFSVDPYEGSYAYLINCVDANYKNGTATVSIRGGRFHNWNPMNNAAEGAGTSFVADGYRAIAEDNVYVVAARLLGDVSGDGRIDTLDITRLLDYTAKKPVEIDLSAADVDGNGKVNATDIAYMINYVTGRITKFPAQK